MKKKTNEEKYIVSQYRKNKGNFETRRNQNKN